jgi:hypothetical protein
MRRAIVISAMLGVGFIAVLVVHAGGQQEPCAWRWTSWANRWGSELNYVVTPVCTTNTQPTYNAVVGFMVWNGCAQQTHLGDGNTNDAAWNALWAGNYERLNALAFSLESSYDWPPTDAGTSFLDC